MAAMPRVGFIGLGFMGHGMARNILATGFPLTVMAHRKREAVEDLVARGAYEAKTANELAGRSDVVLLCVTGAAEVDALVRGENGIAAGAQRGLVVVDCTTSDPSTLLRLAQDFGGKGITFVDSPLGRSPKEAWAGTLSVMVGCEAADLERIRPVLEAFANVIQHAGKLGDGHRLKLVNNLIALGFATVYSEALVMARKAGLSTETFDALVRSSRMHSAFYDTFVGWALDGNAATHPFAIDTALYTIEKVDGFGRSLGMSSGLREAVRATFQSAVDRGFGPANLPELVRAVAAANGFELKPAHPPKN